ncbi:hypothetical protein OHR68_19535 [Spirillospora sp. NBC_00431]
MFGAALLDQGLQIDDGGLAAQQLELRADHGGQVVGRELGGGNGGG